MLPIVLTSPAQHLAVVIGAGAVGLRKCAMLLAAGFRVRLVDSLVSNVPGGVEAVAQHYHADVLLGAFLVVVCTNRAEVNSQVVADCTARNLLVCDTTEPTRGNFVFPATWSSGPIRVSVSTGGAAPTLAIRLAKQLGDSLDASLPDYVALLAELRAEVLQRLTDELTRRTWLRKFASVEFQEWVKSVGVEEARSKVLMELGG